ncbi:MAG TPA: cytochrome c biogenesis protein CcsA, partial [Planctomycetota bacterium]|nr:cytochrome c biogenesis protein CcsA [Planctomycetota bacterium]
GARTGHFPVTGAIEAYIFLTTAIVLIALLLDWMKKWTSLVVAILPLAVVTTLLALALTLVPEDAGRPMPTASSVWTSLHVSTALASYGAFAIAFVSSILYLIAQRQLKDHAAAAMLGLTPSLETVARVNRRSIATGIALLAGGLVVGYLQARHVYGIEHWWRNDPKIYLTTFTLASYVAILILSFRPTFKGRRTALASAAGFLLVMATFWASVFWSDFHRFH